MSRMRSPSARVLINRVDIRFPVQGQDADGGPSFTYPAVSLQGVPCSVQKGTLMEVVDEQQRITQEQMYEVLFGAQPEGTPNIPARARIDYVDWEGVLHLLFARAASDEAGRGSTTVMVCVEKV